MGPTDSGGRARRPVAAGPVEHGPCWWPAVRLLSIEHAVLSAALVLWLISRSSNGQGYVQPGVDPFGRKRFRCDDCGDEQSYVVPPPPEERLCTGCTPPKVLRPVRGS
jgi:hypothetical protein